MFDPVQEYSSDNRVVDENSMRKRYLALGLEDYDLTSLFLSAIDRQETGENSQKIFLITAILSEDPMFSY